MNDLGRSGHRTLGAFLRSRCEAAGLTQEALARQAGISLGALRDLEQGRTVRPRRQSLLKLAAALRLEGTERQEFISADLSPGTSAGPGITLRHEVPGSLAAWRDGRPLALGPPAQRAVLGRLALHTGTRLRRDALYDRALGLWRGPALEDIPALRGHPVATGLDQQRSTTVIEC